MGLGPSKIVDGLYVGSIRDGTDRKKLTDAKITHIVSLLSDKQKGGLTGTKKQQKKDKFTEPVDSADYVRLQFILEDKSNSKLSVHFREASEFIHKARFINNENVLGMGCKLEFLLYMVEKYK